MTPVNQSVSPAALPAPAQKPVPTKAQRWLLLAVLAVGILFRISILNCAFARWDGCYGVFWLVAMAAVTPFIRRQALQSKTGLACGVAAIALCILQMVHGYEDNELPFYRLLGIPAAMALYLVFASYNIPVRREGAAARLVLASVFCYPFTGIPRFFAAVLSLFSGLRGGRGAWKRWLIGVAVGVPLALCVLLLLMQADAGMERLFFRTLGRMPLERWFYTLLIVLFAAMLFYGPFDRAMRKDIPALRPAAPASWPASTMAIALVPSLAVYAVFVCLQFSYLFGGTLPAALTYSEYARQGFTELNLVAAINFTLFGLTMRYAKPHPVLTALSALLLAANAGIVASAIMRLLLYIGAYGLTMLRVLSLWFAVFLAVLTLFCVVRLVKTRFPVLRVSGIAFLYWFVLLNIPGWSALIRAYNATHGLG